jgi:DNA-binding response OmpR family regulator
MAKVLIVDDDISLQTTLTTHLTLEGFITVNANNGRRGLQIAFRERPDLLLLDVFTPDQDGFTTLKSLRTDDWGKNVPVILYSNVNLNDSILTQVMEYKPAYCLLKSDTHVEEVIEKVLELLK